MLLTLILLSSSTAAQGPAPAVAKIQPDIASWTAPKLVLLKGTTLGATDFEVYATAGNGSRPARWTRRDEKRIDALASRAGDVRRYDVYQHAARTHGDGRRADRRAEETVRDYAVIWRTDGSTLWNANIHYHSLLVDAIPRGARRVLDVGCGDGILSADLIRAGIPHVIGLDLDGQVLERARTRHVEVPVEWQQGDLFGVRFEAGSFDAVVSVATLHHLRAEDALARFAEWVKPGGVVAIVGLAANDWWDLPYAAVAHWSQLAVRVSRGHWEHSASMVWPPPKTYLEMKRTASRVLPGVRYRRHLLGRYSLIWTKPPS